MGLLHAVPDERMQAMFLKQAQSLKPGAKAFFVSQLYGNQLARRVLIVTRTADGNFHRLPAVGDEMELSVLPACPEASRQTPISHRQRRRDFVEHAERAGFVLEMANIKAIRSERFSPPDSSCTLCNRLPGGDATTSMPLSRMSCSSSNAMVA